MKKENEILNYVTRLVKDMKKVTSEISKTKKSIDLNNKILKACQEQRFVFLVDKIINEDLFLMIVKIDNKLFNINKKVIKANNVYEALVIYEEIKNDE